jgi:sensor histidine kinase YesM
VNKQGFKIVQINGISGLIMAIAVVLMIIGIIFVAPTYAIKFLWNTQIHTRTMLPSISFIQATLLWVAGALVASVFFKNKIHLKFKDVTNLSQEEYQKLIEEIESKEKNDENK